MRTICLKVSGLVGAIFKVENKKSGNVYRPQAEADGVASDPVELVLINDRPAGLKNLATIDSVRTEPELLQDPQHHRPTLSFDPAIGARLRGGKLAESDAKWSDQDDALFGEATFRLPENSSAQNQPTAKTQLQKRRFIRLEGVHLDVQGDRPLQYSVESPDDWAGVSWLDYGAEGAGLAAQEHFSRPVDSLGAAALGRVTLGGGVLSLGSFSTSRWTLSKDPLGISDDERGVYYRESLELRWETDADTLEIPIQFLRHGGWDNQARFADSDSKRASELVDSKELRLVLDVSKTAKDEEVSLWLLNTIPKFFRDQTLTPDAGVDFCYSYFYRLSRNRVEFSERAIPHRREIFDDATPSVGGGPWCPFSGLRQNP